MTDIFSPTNTLEYSCPKYWKMELINIVLYACLFILSSINNMYLRTTVVYLINSIKINISISYLIHIYIYIYIYINLFKYNKYWYPKSIS